MLEKIKSTLVRQVILDAQRGTRNYELAICIHKLETVRNSLRSILHTVTDDFTHVEINSILEELEREEDDEENFIRDRKS